MTRDGEDQAAFVQVCASNDDLFALDEGGDVYQYNFNTKVWLRLSQGRSDEGAA